MSTARVAILGASGYVGRELAALVAQHPELHLAACMGARAGITPEPPELPVDLAIEPLDLDRLDGVDAVFVCTPHGHAAPLVQEALHRGCRVVDLSADFRLRDPELYAATYGVEHPCPELLEEAVYGLTEHARGQLATARLCANPGCYPTSILVPLLPLLDAGLLGEGPIISDSKSGVSGAGQAPGRRNVFGAVAENFLAYGVGTHRHAPEIAQVAGTDRVVFVPHLLPMFRGMLSTLYVSPVPGTDADAVRNCLAERYRDEPFVRVFDRGQPETNRVARTNQCHIGVAAVGSQVVITSAIDNLGKGAAGQALQNLNAMLGLPEGLGLR
ncbi:MAG: N-acetyl-gamma-glutamyl-phosphate reductase [Planctomycetes bacterium]|nr:N-acetyl-gamma-glutamyl-phosphate reductase [Planctomycetota bacterium]